MKAAAALLFAGLATGLWAAGTGPCWVLNNGPDAFTAVAGQAAGGPALGLYSLEATGTDTTVTLPMRKEKAFAAAAHPFFALRYRIKSSVRNGGLFFTTDTLTQLSDRSYSPFPIEPDGRWHDLVLDMRTFKHGQWKGTVTSFRYDPANPSAIGDTYDVSRLGFFPSEAAARTFLAAANDTPDYTQEVELVGENCRVLIPGGTLSDGWTRASFLLQGSVPPGSVPLTVCRDGEPVPSRVTSRNFAFYVADKPGTYTLVRGIPEQKRRPLDEAAVQRFGCGPAASDPSAPRPAAERIRIGAWGIFRDGAWDPARLEDFAACGFDLLIATSHDSSFGGKLLTACDDLGVEVYLNDGLPVAQPERAGREYADHPSYAGGYLTDEPGTDAYPRWGAIARAYHAASGKVPYINLLPMYANAAQLKFGAGAAAIEYYDPDPDLYRKYCESYCDLVPTDYICTDIYPLNWTKGRRTTYNAYVESINVIASVARARKREFWCCIQTFAWDPAKRTPNAAEYRWQCHALLAFGCRGLLCWVYGAYSDDFPALTTATGERTPAWYDARTVLWEMRRLSPVYCRYENLGAYTHNCTAATPYLKMSGEYRDFKTIRRLDCPDPLLIGCFAAKKGTGTAFSLVNMTELDANRSTIAKLDLAGTDVVVYRGGVPEVSHPDADGRHWIPLASGEGVFVTVD